MEEGSEKDLTLLAWKMEDSTRSQETQVAFRM